MGPRKQINEHFQDTFGISCRKFDTFFTGKDSCSRNVPCSLLMKEEPKQWSLMGRADRNGTEKHTKKQTSSRAVVPETTELSWKHIKRLSSTSHFSILNCCLSVVSLLDKGHYPENSHVVFCSNKQRSFELFFFKRVWTKQQQTRSNFSFFSGPVH